LLVYINGWAEIDPFLRSVTPVYENLVRGSVHQNVQLLIRGKNDILNVTIFKRLLHKCQETILD